MRPSVVVLGMMTRMPVAGVVWQNVHYLLGLERLGYEAWYVEAHGIHPAEFCTHADDMGSVAAARYIGETMSNFGLGDRWAYHALHDDGSVYGVSAERLQKLYASAALIINLHGGTRPRDEHAATGRLIYLETDPVRLQVELHDDDADVIAFLERHVAFFTFAEAYGSSGCLLPVSDRFEFVPTRQPVVLDLWSSTEGPGDAYTTVGNWRQYWRSVELDGETYTWSKHHEWEKILDLPKRVAAPIELALAGYKERDAERLRDRGWCVSEAAAISDDVDAYRRYVSRSRGELTVAKDQNVRLRTGWFSDRSATYLATGRPVITQDTGFRGHLPTGEGLLVFHDLDSAADAVAEVERDWARHARAAREIATEHFDAEIVLKRLLAEVGV